MQAKLDAVPTKETKKKGKEYSLDEITGERIYKSGPSRKASFSPAVQRLSLNYTAMATDFHSTILRWLLTCNDFCSNGDVLALGRLP